MESPFITHRDKVLGYYSTASWLRRVVLAMWSDGYQIALSPLLTLDGEHADAFFEMTAAYRENGENDPAFMALARECLDRLTAEQAAEKRDVELEEWLRHVRQELRGQGLEPGLTDDRYEWFAVQFDAGMGAEDAARKAGQEIVKGRNSMESDQS